MIDEKEFLQLCKNNGVKAFKVLECLDFEKDVILDTEDIEELFRLCNSCNEKIVFYSQSINYDTSESETDAIKREIKTMIQRKSVAYSNGIFDRLITEEEFDEMVEKRTDEIKQHVALGASVGSDATFDAFISHYGERIGVVFSGEDDYGEDTGEFMKRLADKIMKELDVLYEQRVDEMHAEFEKERKQREENHKNAVNAIKEEVSSSDRILECTNAKFRHAYAKELAASYAEQYDVHITIGEVDIIVDLEYKRRQS